MRKNILTTIALALGLSAQGQTLVNDLILGIYNNEASIQALKSVTLTNGFHIPLRKTATVSIAAFPTLLSQPSGTQNYILNRTFRTAGINLQNLNTARTVDQENQSVQYFDGLGRPMQSAQIMASPTYNDILQYVEYDGFGRESIKYLPHVVKDSKGGAYRSDVKSEQLAYYATTNTWDIHVKKNTKPFSVTVFENSPLNRVQQQGAPGIAWQPPADRNVVAATTTTGRTVVMEYGTNATDDIRLWKVKDNDLGAGGSKYYVKGKLTKTVSKDENWVSVTPANPSKAGTVEEYKDFEGRIVLKRNWETGVKKLDTYYVYDDFGDLRYVIPPGYTDTVVTENEANFNELIYAYRYDGRRRLVEKQIPGKGWEYMVYNKNDQAVLSQDAKQRLRKEWTYSRYDAFGRVTTTGLYTNSNTAQLTRAQMLAYVDAQTGPLFESRTGVANYPTSATTFPIAGTGITIKPLQVNYYDDYTFSGSGTLPQQGITKSQKTSSLLTGSLVYKDDGTSPLLSVIYYDDRGKVIQIASQNHIGGTDYVTNTYTFIGELLSATRIHKDKIGTQTTMITSNEYDHMGRLLATKHHINDVTKAVTLAQNEYNEIGQLKKKNVGGDKDGANFYTGVDYAYNERGWNSGASSTQFSYLLKYNDAAAGKQYNGNIAEQQWAHGSTTLSNVFKYTYDGLNRLKNGTSTGTVMIEDLAYDDMGNITTLKRNVGNTTTLTTTSYSYNNSGKSNRLLSVSGGISGTYTYDENGNATTDRTGMNLRYNHLNLPDSAWNAGATVKVGYLYDAMGNKLRKYSTQGGNRDYVGGIEYNGATIELIQTVEGLALRNSDGTYTYRYNLTDHLGNVRSTVYRNPGNGLVEVLQKDDYYPFGKQRIVAAGNNKYLYNGKETQSELGGQYDYGARFYDADIGRWNSIDPLAEAFENLSPYNYGTNNPILMVDPTGMAADTTVNVSVSAKMGENKILSVTQTTTTTIVDKDDEGMTTTKIVSIATDRVSSDPEKDTKSSDIITNTIKSFRANSGKEKVLDRSSIQESRSKTKVDMGPLKEVTNSLERYRNTNGEQFVTAINRYGTNATAVAGAGAAAPFGTASLAAQLVNNIFGKGSQLATGILAVLPSVGLPTSNYGVTKVISSFGVGNEKIMLIKQNNVERFRFLKK